MTDILKINSPTFGKESIIIYVDTFKRIKDLFIKEYSKEVAILIDKKFNIYYNKIMSIADDSNKSFLKENKAVFSNYLYGNMLEMLFLFPKDFKNDQGFLESQIISNLNKLFFFTDLTIISIKNDYKSIEKILKRTKEMSGRSADKYNLRDYEEVFKINDQRISKGLKSNFRKSAFSVAKQFGYLQIEKQAKLYNRFRKFKLDHNLKDLSSFLGYIKSISQ
ncbi:MAG: hypothetical protein IIA48_06530 [Bacteroidetes bacterium]|nr:hypothetical protein [Bacteroidota bacterium]